MTLVGGFGLLCSGGGLEKLPSYYTVTLVLPVVYSHSTFSPMVRIAICQELLGVGGNVINFYVEVIPIMMLL
jgi:hypothetical protein